MGGVVNLNLEVTKVGTENGGMNSDLNGETVLTLCEDNVKHDRLCFRVPHGSLYLECAVKRVAPNTHEVSVFVRNKDLVCMGMGGVSDIRFTCSDLDDGKWTANSDAYSWFTGTLTLVIKPVP